ncbi:hypothetical protein JTB14_008820 [Gonioctena quinquepunctata]|nr:hypothetical protein JTB14_008820 [Gonioctena quinquepunctata]
MNRGSPSLEDVSGGPAVILGSASLEEMQLHGTGTIMLNRSHNHKKLDLKKDSSMKRGDIVQFTAEDVALVKWRDPRVYLMASNYTGGDQTSTLSRWDEKSKAVFQVLALEILSNYNNCTSNRIKPKDFLWFRVDLADELCESIPQFAWEDFDSSSSGDRLPERYIPAIPPPSFNERFDEYNHLPVFDDLTRGRKCRLESCSSVLKDETAWHLGLVSISSGSLGRNSD